MKNLFEAGKLLLLDMASTFFFPVLYLLTHNITLSVVLGMALVSPRSAGNSRASCRSPPCAPSACAAAAPR